MTPTRRGRAVLAVVITVLLVGGGAAAVLALGGKAGVGPLANNPTPSGTGSPSTSPPPPPICPLSGVGRSKDVPQRPALAIKVENLPEARPQTGLSWADLVYEEPVEGGITRFIAVYQCQDASRVEPVRSGRLTDIDILLQFGTPLMGYSGGAGKVVKAIRDAGIVDISYETSVASSAYHRDSGRQAPHNLYTSTKALYAVGKDLTEQVPPDPIFVYAKKAPKSADKVTEVHVPFSSSSDVFWKWSSSKRVWLRYHGTVAHVSTDGTQFSATNVIVQVVKTDLTDQTDKNGIRSPRAITVGKGKAYVFRNGRVIKGTWVRDSVDQVTKFLDADGNEIKLAPGQTWIELLPKDKKVSFS
jgi:Protein of unknown function (DUF3048) N-terminal domain/Protein of unknown function (DUF3048) C-terminal domain